MEEDEHKAWASGANLEHEEQDWKVLEPVLDVRSKMMRSQDRTARYVGLARGTDGFPRNDRVDQQP